MTRRESVRVVLFARGKLTGVDRSLRCAVVNLSGVGASLTTSARLPTPPLRLHIELGEETIELPVEVQRKQPDGGVAVSFPPPHSERLYRLIAVEQRRALAQGRINISDRRRSQGSSKPRAAKEDPRSDAAIERRKPGPGASR